MVIHISPIVISKEIYMSLVRIYLFSQSSLFGNSGYIDGRKQFPINHGPTSVDSVLEDSCKVVKQFMERQPNELRFTIIALSKAPSSE